KSLCLLLGRENADIAVDGLAPCTPAWRGSAGIVEADHQVSERSDVAVEERAAAAPAVERGLPRWFAVDVHQDRVFLRRIKVGRLDHPAVHHYTVAGIDLEELRWRCEELCDLCLVLGTVAASTYELVIRQRHQFAQPRIIDTRETVKGILPVGRNIVTTDADEIARSDAHRIGRPVEGRAVKVAVSRVIGRRYEIEPPALFIDALNPGSIHGPTRNQCFMAAAINRPDMHPAIFFADGEELAALMNRLRFRQSTKADGDEGVVVIAPHLVHGTRAGVGEQIIVGVL